MHELSSHRDGFVKVDLWLEVCGRRYALAQVAPDWIIPRDPIDLPMRTRGVVIVSVDGRESRHPIELVERMTTASTIVPTRDLESQAPQAAAAG